MYKYIYVSHLFASVIHFLLGNRLVMLANELFSSVLVIPPSSLLCIYRRSKSSFGSNRTASTQCFQRYECNVVSLSVMSYTNTEVGSYTLKLLDRSNLPDLATLPAPNGSQGGERDVHRQAIQSRSSLHIAVYNHCRYRFIQDSRGVHPQAIDSCCISSSLFPHNL